jgi:DNA mismatch repair protein MutL
MPPEEVDVNVHPAKTEVRFRQQSFIHDFVRDSIRTTLMKARPAAAFVAALTNNPHATPTLLPDVSPLPGGENGENGEEAQGLAASEESSKARNASVFELTMREPSPEPGKLPFSLQEAATIASSSYASTAQPLHATNGNAGTMPVTPYEEPDEVPANLNALASLKPLGQLRESFILAVNDEGLWIIDQHVAHERVLFEKILRERQVERVQRQRLLMPLLVDLQPHQMVTFASLAEELERNGFEVEPFGPRTLAVKAAPVGLEGSELERVLTEVIDQTEKERQTENLETVRTRIAASIACHSAIKVNMPLDSTRIEWLLKELAKTEHPTSCPHGRPIALRYAWKDIQRAFQRI